MIKRIDSSSDWCMFDSARAPYNLITKQLFANATTSESGIGSGNFIDFTSNGFKLRNTAGDKNASGGQYAYMAFADSPIDFANAR
jgi:hypothetical protein